jgi:hypothetical protein
MGKYTNWSIYDTIGRIRWSIYDISETRCCICDTLSEIKWQRYETIITTRWSMYDTHHLVPLMVSYIDHQVWFIITLMDHHSLTHNIINWSSVLTHCYLVIWSHSKCLTYSIWYHSECHTLITWSYLLFHNVVIWSHSKCHKCSIWSHLCHKLIIW